MAGCPPTQPPTQKLRSVFTTSSIQKIGSSLISVEVMHSGLFDELLKEPNSGTQEISLTKHASYCLHQREFTPESESFWMRIWFNSILILLAVLDTLFLHVSVTLNIITRKSVSIKMREIFMPEFSERNEVFTVIKLANLRLVEIPVISQVVR